MEVLNREDVSEISIIGVVSGRREEGRRSEKGKERKEKVRL